MKITIEIPDDNPPPTILRLLNTDNNISVKNEDAIESSFTEIYPNGYLYRCRMSQVNTTDK